MTACPLPFDKDAGRDALGGYPDLPGEMAALLLGTAGSSPYLAGILRTERDWVVDALAQPTEIAFAALLDGLPDTHDQLGPALRIAKRRAALLIALADLGGIWDVSAVTDALTTLADTATQVGLRAIQSEAIDRNRLPACTPEDLATGCGMAVLGMGKHGARELNYSSDIDLIVLFDETRFDPGDYAEVRQGFVRITQALVKLLSAQTEHGYVFRTDLRLRPDSAVTPVCMAMEPAERYYESVGRTWERAAMIKARTIAGDFEAGAGFLDRLRPFIWRRHLDFAAIQDAQDMVLKIRTHKGLDGAMAVAGHDLKLGRGGIREIEFFAQTHQLIFGGREPALRSPRTTEALSALAAHERIAPPVAEGLIKAYEAHRGIEHRIQMIDDAQTHVLPADPEKRLRLAHLAGSETLEAFDDQVFAALEEVQSLTEVQRIGDTEDKAPELDIPLAFRDAFDHAETGWQSRPALRTPRARELYAGLRGELIRRLLTAADPNDALARFDTFLSGLPAGVQVFSLFDSNPQLLALMIDVCTVSPELARYLGRNAGVLDAVTDRDFYSPIPDAETLGQDLGIRLADVDDYEMVLDTTRRWQKEQHFRAGVHLMRGIADPTEAGLAYTSIAVASVASLLPHCIAQLAPRFGPPPGRGAAVIGMGKLGAGEMTAASDLDMIVVYDAPADAMTSGRKEISAGAYYSRLTQTLIAALTAPTAEGSLYEVDMRLRPSGRKGPVATSLNAFAEYQRTKAWTWEHLALTRAEVIAGPKDLAADVNAAIAKALAQPRDGATVLKDVADMRARLQSAKADAAAKPWNVKQGPGQLMDIELAAQAGVLITGMSNARRAADALPRLVETGWIAKDDADTLAQTHRLCAAIQHVARLIGPEFDPTRNGAAAAKVLMRAIGHDWALSDMDQLLPLLRDRTDAAARIVAKLIDP